MADLHWQVAGSSNTAHVMDLDKPAPRWSGRQSLCRRRPQRNYSEWFDLEVSEPRVKQILDGFSIHQCEDCLVALPAPVADPSGNTEGETR